MNVGNATQGPNGKLATVNALNGAATPSGNNGTGGPAAVNVGNATPGPNGKAATVNALNGAQPERQQRHRRSGGCERR